MKFKKFNGIRHNLSKKKNFFLLQLGIKYVVFKWIFSEKC